MRAGICGGYLRTDFDGARCKGTNHRGKGTNHRGKGTNLRGKGTNVRDKGTNHRDKGTNHRYLRTHSHSAAVSAAATRWTAAAHRQWCSRPPARPPVVSAPEQPARLRMLRRSRVGLTAADYTVYPRPAPAAPSSACGLMPSCMFHAT